MCAKKTIFVDEQGIWRKDTPTGKRYGIAWDEVLRITAYKTDDLSSLNRCVTLETNDKLPFEIDDGCDGFMNAAHSISARFHGCLPNWYSLLLQLPSIGKVLMIWPPAQQSPASQNPRAESEKRNAQQCTIVPSSEPPQVQRTLF
jgi:hypothetical protein